jgi:hypothetical protein
MPELGDSDLDPHLLLWDIHRNVDTEAVPPGRTVLEFRFTDVPGPASRWWIVIDDHGVDVCDADPGFDVRVTVRSTLRAMTEVWRGDRSWREVSQAGDLELLGDAQARRALPRWLKLSTMAGTPRPLASAAV